MTSKHERLEASCKGRTVPGKPVDGEPPCKNEGSGARGQTCGSTGRYLACCAPSNSPNCVNCMRPTFVKANVAEGYSSPGKRDRCEPLTHVS